MSDPRPEGDRQPGGRAASAKSDQLAFTNFDAQGETPGAAAAGAVPGPGAAANSDEGTVEAVTNQARLDLVLDVPVWLSVELGRTEIPIREVVNLGRGSMVELDRGPGAPLDVRVNGVLIGRGEIVLINDERLGLRFLEVVSPAERTKRSD
ncbi:MAG TPA: flagellar motor switch protein FliN [Stellaceae bacterium]|jgi:flagellar motor switch protein FliN/FliY|nr:flagellar motor switch protein FliN [Stellaceae bacterium]